jgi:HEAT repeat protein
LEAIAGFEVLGTNCAPAVAVLAKLLEDKELAFVALRCLDNVGKAAEVPLCRCLTNRDAQVRSWSVASLASVTPDVEVYLDRIKPRLSDVEPAVRVATVQAIAAQTEAPDLAVPLLISALRDDAVFSSATDGLAGFGTNALSAFPMLTNVIAIGTEGQKRAALKALAILTPAATVPMLSNAVTSGSAQLMGDALRQLKSIAPESALRMTLQEFQSNDTRRQSVALNLAGTYNLRTAGIVEALKEAASSDDPEVAHHALMTMRLMLEKEKKEKPEGVKVPNEPSYQGKPLGEWLRTRCESGELETNAVEALRAMGTNVIPALLARLTYQEPVFGLDDYEVSMSGATGLITIREQAKPALPSLSALMDSDNGDLALRAMVAMLGMGADAIPYLVRGLTNRFPTVRSEAAHFLTEWGAQYPKERKRAIPEMIKLLNDPDRDIRMSVANDLKEIDAETARSAGVK